MAYGTIKHVNPRGYGFIAADNDSNEDFSEVDTEETSERLGAKG